MRHCCQCLVYCTQCYYWIVRWMRFSPKCSYRCRGSTSGKIVIEARKFVRWKGFMKQNWYVKFTENERKFSWLGNIVFYSSSCLYLFIIISILFVFVGQPVRADVFCPLRPCSCYWFAPALTFSYSLMRTDKQTDSQNNGCCFPDRSI